MRLDILTRSRVCEDFSHLFHSFGVHPVAVDYYDANYLDITVRLITELERCMTVVSENQAALSTAFIRLWREQGGDIDLTKYGAPPHLYFPVHSMQDRYICRLVREAKNAITDAIAAALPHELIPRYVFTHSSDYEHGSFPAGYNIVFANPEALHQSKLTAQKVISDTCMEILNGLDHEKMFHPSYCSLQYFDATNCNLYGMSRQD